MSIHRVAFLYSVVSASCFPNKAAPEFLAPTPRISATSSRRIGPNPPECGRLSRVWNLIQVASCRRRLARPRGRLHRGAHPVLEFDSSGRLLRAWGNGTFKRGKRSGQSRGAIALPAPRVTPLSMAGRDANLAARTRCASMRREHLAGRRAGSCDLQAESAGKVILQLGGKESPVWDRTTSTCRRT